MKNSNKINVLYLHGLDATPESDHVSILKSKGINIVSPYFDYRKGKECIFDFISNEMIDNENIQGVIGHSFGGFLAYYISNKHHIPCLIFNPAFDERNYYTVPNDVRKLKPYSNQIAVVGSNDIDVPSELQLGHLDKSKTDVYIEEIEHDIPDNIKLKYFYKFVLMLNSKKQSGGEIKNPIYSAVFIDSDELKSKYPPIHSKQFYHHSTIEFRPKTIKDLPIGEEVDLKITGRLITDNFDILLIENKFTDKKNPHITLSISEGLTPAQSNKEIEEYYEKIKPLNDSIKGYVGFFDGFVHKEKINSDILNVSEIEILIGRKLHWWNDNIIFIHGVKYKKIFLRPEYRKI